MPHPVKGIDHVFLLADDLDVSLSQFKKLGFTVSPRGFHSAAKGSANHTIMFPHDYFELLGIISETPGNEARRKMLAESGQGLHAIACRVDSASDAQRSLAELGIGTHGLIDFSRPVELPDGSDGVAAFSTVIFDPEMVPLGSVFMCQHKTRDVVWIPELLEHGNGAVGLDRITGVSDTPEESARRLARLFAAGSVEVAGGCAVVSTGDNSADVEFIGPSRLAERHPGFDLSLVPRNAFAAVGFRVAGLDATRSVLDRNDVPYADAGTWIAVGPEHASGAIVTFGC